MVQSFTTVIPCHNYARFLRSAVTSVLDQGYPSDIVVVDDASTDEPAAALAGLDVRVIRHSTRLGAAAARNTGWRASTTEWIAFLDADDVWLPGKLDAQVSYLEAFPDCKFLYADMVRFDRFTSRIVGLWSDDLKPVTGKAWRQLLVENVIPCCTVIIRRDVLEAVGGFDEQLEAYEDIDLWVRVAQRWPLHYLSKPVAEYRMHGKSLSRASSAMANGRFRSIMKALSCEDPTESVGEILGAGFLDLGVAEYLEHRSASARRFLLLAAGNQPSLLPKAFPVYLKSLVGRHIFARLGRRR